MENDEKNIDQQDDTVASRREFRSLIFHLLYAMEEWDYSISLEAMVDNFNRGFDLVIPTDGDIISMSSAIIDERQTLDAMYKPLLANWRIERLGLCTRLILRLAIWELNNTDTAPQIIINEAIELAKCFAEKDAYKFVNGILDQLFKLKT